MLVEILLFIAVAILISYITLMFTGKSPSYQGSHPMYNLEDATSIVLPEANCHWNGHPTSLRFAIYIQQAPKTIEKVDCISSKSTVLTFMPSCLNYVFEKCECVATNCTECTKTPSYLSKVLYIDDVFSLFASGYTSSNDKPLVPALLKIKTASDGKTNHYMESISLPAIPLQRWTVVTIVKEGRRIDVYYGEKAVASKLLEHMPLSSLSGSDWKSCGMTNWKGKIGLFTGTANAKTQDVINADVEALVNTRGIPFYLDQINFSFNISMPECMFGNCNKLPAVKPLNPFAVYASSVQ